MDQRQAERSYGIAEAELTPSLNWSLAGLGAELTPSLNWSLAGLGAELTPSLNWSLARLGKEWNARKNDVAPW